MSLVWLRVPAVRSIIEVASASDPADPDAAPRQGGSSNQCADSDDPAPYRQRKRQLRPR